MRFTSHQIEDIAAQIDVLHGDSSRFPDGAVLMGVGSVDAVNDQGDVVGRFVHDPEDGWGFEPAVPK